MHPTADTAIAMESRVRVPHALSLAALLSGIVGVLATWPGLFMTGVGESRE